MRWAAILVLVAGACSDPSSLERAAPEATPSEAAPSEARPEAAPSEAEAPALADSTPEPSGSGSVTAGDPAMDVPSDPGALAGHPSLLLRTIGASRGFAFARGHVYARPSGHPYTVLAREDGSGVTICRKPARRGCVRVEGAVLAPKPIWMWNGRALVPILVDGDARAVVLPEEGELWIAEDARPAPPPEVRLPWRLGGDPRTHNDAERTRNAFYAQVRQEPPDDAERPVSVEAPAWVRPFYRRALAGFEVKMLAREGARRVLAVDREDPEPGAYPSKRVRVVVRDAAGLWRTSPRMNGSVFSASFADDWEPGAVFVLHEPSDDAGGSSLGLLYGKDYRLAAIRTRGDALEWVGSLPLGESFFVRVTPRSSKVWRWRHYVRVPGAHRIALRPGLAYGARFDRTNGELSDIEPFVEIEGFREGEKIRPGSPGVYRWVVGGRRFVRESAPEDG